MEIRGTAFVGSVVLYLFATSGFAEDRAASGKPRYLPAEAYQAAPPEVIAEIKARNCSVPQTSSKKPHNLISGQFVTAGRRDWAILCSKEGKSSIQLLTNDKNACLSPLEQADDVGFIQQVENGRNEYSRLIKTETRKNVVKHTKAMSSPDLNAKDVEHDGLRDIFLGKASTIFYCRNGKWISMEATD
jgi:hypothetical protein